MKMTRKSLAEHLLAQEERIKKTVQANAERFVTDEDRELVYPITIIHEGVSAIKYRCTHCGTETIIHTSYTPSNWKCPHCGNTRVAMRGRYIVQGVLPSTIYHSDKWLYFEKTSNGFIAASYSVIAAINSANPMDDVAGDDWAQYKATIKTNTYAMAEFDYDVGFVMGDHSKCYYRNMNDSTLNIYPRNTPSVADTFWQLLSKPRLGDQAVSNVELMEIIKSAKASLEQKKRAPKSKQSTQSKSEYALYDFKPIDTAKIKRDNAMRVGQIYSMDSGKGIFRAYCSCCGNYEDLEFEGTNRYCDNSLLRELSDVYPRDKCVSCGTTFVSDIIQTYNNIKTITIENTNLPKNDLLMRYTTYYCQVLDGKMTESFVEYQRVFVNGVDKKIRIFGTEYNGGMSLDKELKSNRYLASVFNCLSRGSSEPYFLQSRDEIRECIEKSSVDKTGLAESWGLNPLYPASTPVGSLIYFIRYSTNPSLEYVAKSPYAHLVSYCYHNDTVLKYGAKNLSEAIDVPKAVLKLAMSIADTISMEQLNNLKILYSVDQSVTLDTLSEVTTKELNVRQLRYLCEKHGVALRKSMAYLDKVYDHQCIVRKHALSEWVDYLDMASKINMDLTNKSIKFPDSLRKEHDVATFAYNTLKQEADQAKFKQRAEDNDKLYAYSYGDFIAIVPQTPEDIVNEASQQHNCLRSYIERVAEGRTAVVFIRRKEAPEISYVSVEIFENTLTQIKLAYNKNPNDVKLREFLEHWCKAKDLKISAYC